MLLIRRLYVYLICGISLLILAIAFQQLLEIGVLQIWDSLGGSRLLEGTGDDVRQEVSLNLALVAVSLPIWALHWYLAERWSIREGAESDRGSGIRALYFAAVLAVAAINLATDLYPIINGSLSALFDVTSPSSSRELIASSTGAIVALSVWGYHAWIRERDVRMLAMSGAGVWPVRLYMYAAAFAGAIVMLTGLAELLSLAMDALVERQDLVIGDGWQAASVSAALTRTLVGGVFWGLHWTYSLRLVYGTDWRTQSERQSRLRWAYLYLSVIAGVAGSLVSIIVSLTEALRWILGVDPGTADPLWSRLLTPLVIAVPFLFYWLFHRRIIQVEAAHLADRPLQASVNRVYTYSVALISLAFAAVGLGYLLGVLIEFLFENARILDTDPEWVPEQISVFLSITAVGGIVWAWYWTAAQRRLAVEPDQERISTSRRVFIYLVLTATTLTVLGTLAYILYQALQLLLGVRTTTGLASDVGLLLGVLIVAGGVLSYHLLILRDDLRQSPKTGVAEAEAGEQAIPEPASSLSLTLIGPVTADLEAIAGDLRTHLPDGIELRAEGVAEADAPTGVAAESDETEITVESDDEDLEDPDHETRIFT